MSVCHFISKLSQFNSFRLIVFTRSHVSIIVIVIAPAVRVYCNNHQAFATYTTIYILPNSQRSHVMFACATKESRQTSTSQRNPSLHSATTHLSHIHSARKKRVRAEERDWKRQQKYIFANVIHVLLYV